MSGKARRENGEGSVYQDKNCVWHAKLNLGRYKNGKRRFKEFQGKRKADVIARRDVYLREHGDLSLEPGANMSFADYITRWLENVKRNEQKEATYIRTVSTANTYIIPMIGGYKVAELTSSIIQLHLINEMRDMTCERTGEELSWSSIQKASSYKGRKPAQLPPDFDALYARYQCRELNKTQLAAAVGVSRPTLERLLRDYLE